MPSFISYKEVITKVQLKIFNFNPVEKLPVPANV